MDWLKLRGKKQELLGVQCISVASSLLLIAGLLILVISLHDPSTPFGNPSPWALANAFLVLILVTVNKRIRFLYFISFAAVTLMILFRLYDLLHPVIFGQDSLFFRLLRLAIFSSVACYFWLRKSYLSNPKAKVDFENRAIKNQERLFTVVFIGLFVVMLVAVTFN